MVRRSGVIPLGHRSIGRPARPALVVAAILLLAGCGAPSNETPPPWKESAPPVLESERPVPAADASGVVPGCPVTLAEARAAVPDLVSGPEVGIAAKNVTEDCTFLFPERDLLGRPVGVGILVFDAQGEGSHMWDSVRTDPNFPNVTDVAGLGDAAFVTGTAHPTDLFAVQGQVALHISTLRPQGLTVEQLTALARSAFNRLKP